jgi:hypothetical protein
MTNKRWFELTGRDLPGSTTFQRRCPIIASKGRPGGSWENLPSTQYGWDAESSTITILNVFRLQRFDPRTDARKLERLFELEALPEERSLRPDEGHKSLLQRLVVKLPMLSTHSFTEPSDTEYDVLVHTNHSEEIDPTVDFGSLIRLASLPPVAETRQPMRTALLESFGTLLQGPGGRRNQ